MGTGIVSTGLNINGAHTVSAVLLVVGLIGAAFRSHGQPRGRVTAASATEDERTQRRS